MTIEATTPIRRSDALLYLVGIMLSVPPLISLVHRQFAVPVAGDIHQFMASYRQVADAMAGLLQSPLKAVSIPIPKSLMDLQVLSFAGMGMMSRGMKTPGEKDTFFGALVWTFVSAICAYLLIGILVFGAILALVISKPMMAFRSDHWIETTPILEGPQLRLRREREMRLERDLARIMMISAVLVGGYFAINSILLGGH
jgi:ABC-type sugar transport system permease subunit